MFRAYIGILRASLKLYRLQNEPIEQQLGNDYRIILGLFGVFIHEIWNKSREPAGFELIYVQSHE